TPPQESELLIAAGRELGVFLAQLFPVDGGPAQLHQRAQRDAQVARFKKEFVAKRVAKATTPAAVDAVPIDALIRSLAGGEFGRDPELALACTANKLLDIEREYPRSAKAATPSGETRASLAQLRDSLHASHAFEDSLVRHEPVESPEAIARETAAVHGIVDMLVDWTAAQWKAGRFDGWTSFHLPKPLVFDHLVDTKPIDELRVVGNDQHYRRRDGFKLTDPRATPRMIADQAHYCIYCHERTKDSCSHGFPE